MALRSRDPLLNAARLILLAMMTVAAAIAGVLAVSLPAMFLFPSQILALLAHWGVEHPAPERLGLLAAAMGLTIVISLIAMRGQQLLLRLIDSVALGDPFVPDNAARLQQMAWLTAAVQALALTLNAILYPLWSSAGHDHAGFDVSLGGILLFLLLLILARVFKQGAMMREELEGTV